jgi:glycosyltransferase involved in cell wall biosynthesis
MRVMHVISSLGTYGAERFLRALLERFDEPDIELGVATIAGMPPPPSPSYVTFGARRQGPADLLFLARLVTTIRRWSPDIVHTHTHHGKYWGRLAAIAAGTPVIVHTEHNSEFGAPAPYRLLNNLLTAHTETVITLSQEQRRRVARDEGTACSKLIVIPNGIALPPFETSARCAARVLLSAQPDDVLITTVGRLMSVKNQQLAIETVRRLPLPRARLILVGEGVDRADLERLAESHGLTDRVTFLGYRSDASQLVSAADVALVTSLNEAMPLTVIEAMSARVPIVSVPWKGAHEMLGDGTYGVVAPSYDPEDVAGTVQAIFADPDGSAERADRAFAHAHQEYDIATTVRRHAELYRTLYLHRACAATKQSHRGATP